MVWRFLESQCVLVLSAAVLVIVIDRSNLLFVRLSDSIKFYQCPKPVVGSASRLSHAVNCESINGFVVHVRRPAKPSGLVSSTSTFLKEFSLNVKFFWLFLNCKRNDSHALVKTLVLTSRFYSSVVDGWSSFGFYGGYRLDLISGSCKRSFHGVCTSTHSFVGPMPAGADML